MNRPIKFRAWDRLNKLMVNGLSITFQGRIMVTKKRGPDGKYAFKEQPGYDLERYQLMQFTGLTDKNGKEIYEGDIVEFTMIDKDNGALRLPVVWHEKSAGFVCDDGKRKRGVDMAYGFDTISGEVIGSIYENPELLTD